MSKDISAANTAKKNKRLSAGKIVLICLGCLLCAAALYLLAMMLFSKDGKGVPLPTEAPEATQQAAYTTEHIIRYWPEDADYSTCDYACIMDKPVFARTQTAGAAMNEAVEAYFDGLFERIENEYTPAAVAKPPYTEVGCRVEFCGEYTNVIFTEEHCYEAQPFKQTRVLILDERGAKVNANDVFRTYHSDTRIAETVLEQMAASGHFYNDVTVNDVLAKLDIANGCLPYEGGATVFLPEGVFAPYDYGELSFKVPVESIVPDVVGETLSLEEYGRIMALTDAVSSACIVRETNVEGGVMTPYAATAFMGAVIQRSDYAAEKGRIAVPADEFEQYYRACFGQEFPGIDTDGFDIKLENGAYSVSSTQKVYEYHLDILEAVREGDSLTLNADLVFGGFGYPYSTPVCHVTVRLTESAESPYGFRLDDYIMEL